MTQSRLLRLVVFLLLPAALGALLLRAGCAEVAPRQSGLDLPVYDPRSYYQLVNERVAPQLEFCPLLFDPSQWAGVSLGDSEIDTWLDRAEAERLRAPANLPTQRRDVPTLDLAPARCDCGTRRISALFCVRPEVNQAQLERFARLSWLGEDLNVHSRWQFRPETTAEGRRIAVELKSGLHRQPLPSDHVSTRYDGTVYYRPAQQHLVLVDQGGSEHVLVGGSRPVQVDLDEWLAIQQHAESGRPERLVHAGDPVVFVRNRRDVLRLHVGFGGTPLLLEVPQGSGEASQSLALSIDGRRLPALEVHWILGLQPQEQLQLQWGTREPLGLRLSSARSGVLSELRLSTRSAVRVFDDSSGVDDYVRALTGALGDTLAALGSGFRECHNEKSVSPTLSLPNVQPLAQADIWLTLDQVLQGAAQKTLMHYAETGAVAVGDSGLHFATTKTAARAHGAGLWKDGARLAPPPHLSLLVLDADAGDILAAASYPSTQTARRMLADLEQLRGAEPAVVRLLREDLEREVTRQTNLHLQRHVVGSTFKPLFAWAAGTADPALLDFTLPREHPVDWEVAGGVVRNRLIDQCLISARKSRDGKSSHFQGAYSRPEFWASCDGRTGHGEEDLCLALAASDTYWFNELGVRVMAATRNTLHRDVHPVAIPGRGVPYTERNYDLTAVCQPQTLLTDAGPRRLCEGTAPQRGSGRWMPAACQSGDDRLSPICTMRRLLDVNLQPVGGPNDATPSHAFLGPLIGLVDRVAMPLEGQCPALPSWQSKQDSGFLWLLPAATEWSTDLLQSCTPFFEMFIQGAYVNLWNNVMLAQSYGRLLSGNETLAARIIADVVEGGRADTRAPAGPSSAARHGSVTSVDTQCTANPRSPRCLVLRGMQLSIEQGTLRALHELPRWLEQNLRKRGAELKVRLWGKTGTTVIESFPAYRPATVSVAGRTVRAGGRFTRRPTLRKSLHTVLLIEAEHAQAARPLRRFVVYLAIEGVDERLTSVTGAAPFFVPAHPGSELLAELLQLAAAEENP